jgi:hypothetical protein
VKTLVVILALIPAPALAFCDPSSGAYMDCQTQEQSQAYGQVLAEQNRQALEWQQQNSQQGEPLRWGGGYRQWSPPP